LATFFARRLDAARDRVIVDHHLNGDGWRTRQTEFAEWLDRAGFSEWNTPEKLREVRDPLVDGKGPCRRREPRSSNQHLDREEEGEAMTPITV
jgi:hypothetical protein